jgi:hypothetical protein
MEIQEVQVSEACEVENQHDIQASEIQDIANITEEGFEQSQQEVIMSELNNTANPTEEGHNQSQITIDSKLHQALLDYYAIAKPEAAHHGTKLRKNWQIKEGLYYMGDRLYIPAMQRIRLRLLQDHHDIPTAGHQGIQRTLEKLQRNYYWETLRSDCAKYVNSCDSCQRNKSVNHSPYGLLQSLPIPEDRFKTLCIDYCSMPKSRTGKDCCLILTDKLTKFVKLIPVTTTITAKETAKLLLQHWYCNGFGIPSQIISDRDPRFISQLWTKFLEQLGITQTMSTARHQQTNGLAEHMVKMVKNCLRAYADYQGKNWVDFIYTTEFALNDSVSSVTKFTPFELVLGTKVNKLKTGHQEISRQLIENISLAKQNIAANQDRVEVQANLERATAPEIRVGSKVLVNRTGIVWPADQHNNNKLLSRYIGPFEVTDIDHFGNCTLDLPTTLRIHNKFAVDVLKLYQEPNQDFPTRRSSRSLTESHPPDQEFEIEKILDHKYVNGRLHYLVKWKNYGTEHNSWEPRENFAAPDAVTRYQQARGGVVRPRRQPVGKNIT